MQKLDPFVHLETETPSYDLNALIKPNVCALMLRLSYMMINSYKQHLSSVAAAAQRQHICWPNVKVCFYFAVS